MQEQELLALARDARTLFAANAGKSWLVAPSAPVLFFGDLPGVGESTPRVATVALNPSRREFPAADPFKRFPGAESPDDASYLRSLFGYFRTAPYVSWFDFYEQALLGIGTSYYGNSDAVALHTDIGLRARYRPDMEWTRDPHSRTTRPGRCAALASPR